MKKIIYVASSAEIKRGTKNGRQWVMYSVVDKDGTKYTAFDGRYVGLVGQEVEIEYEEKQNGKYLNRTILEPKRVQAQGSGFNDLDRKVLYQLFKKVEALQTALAPATLSKPQPAPQPQENKDITADDLPF